LRVAIDIWLEHGGKGRLTKYIQDAFANLKAEV